MTSEQPQVKKLMEEIARLRAALEKIIAVTDDLAAEHIAKSALSSQWDEGYDEGCGPDSQRAFDKWKAEGGK